MAQFSRRKMLSMTTLAFCSGIGIASGAEVWTEGREYTRVNPPLADAPAITEIFSYGCPGCNAFQPFMQALTRKLPAGALVNYLPASWLPAENWPVFQRAYLTAKALGVASKAHDAMYAAIWKTGELAIMNPATNRPKSPLPSLQDVARFYERVTAVPAAKFVETSRSFAVETDIRRTDKLITGLRAESTPTLIVRGIHRLTPVSAGGGQQAVDLATWLLQKR